MVGTKRKYTASKAKPAKPTKYQKTAAQMRVAANARTGGQIGQEIKNYDTVTNLTGGFNGDTSVPRLLSGITQGVGPTQRDGRQVKSVGLDVRWDISVPSNATSATPVRILVVKDTQSNGANMQLSDVLTNNSASETLSNNADPIVLDSGGGYFLAFNNLSNTGRFRTLLDERYIIDPANQNYLDVDSAFIGTSSRWTDSKHITLNDKITFNGTTGAIAACNDISYQVFIISGNAAIAVTFIARLRFIG